MFARFDENPAKTHQDIKKTKRYGRTHTRRDGRTDNVKTVFPPQTKFAGGIKTKFAGGIIKQECFRALDRSPKPCEIILNLDRRFRRCCLKTFLI